MLIKCSNIYEEQEDYYLLKIINTHKQSAICLFDKDDLEEIQKHSWTIRKDEQGHFRVCSEGKMLHQFLFNYDSNKVIDHINQNPLDNRRCNLRITTMSINATNARPRTENSSGVRGVYFRKSRPGISKDSWICEWSIEKKRYTKSFSCEKYGYDEAFELAKSYRENKLKEMKI